MQGGGYSRSDAGSVLDIMRPLLGPGSYIGIYTASAPLFGQSIALNSPLILGLAPQDSGGVGHAVVLTGIRFSFWVGGYMPGSFLPLPINTPIITEYWIYDPATGRTEDIDNPGDLSQRILWCVSFVRNG